MRTQAADDQVFSRNALRAMILPLFFEQLLVMLVGMADTLVVSYAGDAAVSGVSLVNQFNNIFILLFSALASGGAVVISQYVGSADLKEAGRSASQLLMLSTILSVVCMVVVLIFRKGMLQGLFGAVEADVMKNCLVYLEISAYSFPFLAIYNVGASVFRSIGKTSVTMVVSILSNVINIIGNCIGAFVFHAGAAGVAWPSLIARAFSAAAITLLVLRQKNNVTYPLYWIFHGSLPLQKQILKIALPNSMEDGIFQLVKVGLSSIVALFGTTQIAANGIAQSFWSMAALAGVSMSPVFITVIGQCMGRRQPQQAQGYFKRLLKITLLLSTIWNVLILVLSPLFLNLYDLSAEVRTLTLVLILIHNVFNALAYPFSGALAAGLRAAGDVRFTMLVSIGSTLMVRLVFSWIFGVVLNGGVIGIAFAMALDWCVRGVIFGWRLKSGRWKNFRVI